MCIAQCLSSSCSLSIYCRLFYQLFFFVCNYSLVEFEDVSQSITSLATLFANDSSEFITSIQPDVANPMNLLVTTWHAVYTVPVDGSNSAAHIVGDMSKDGKIFVN